jgi:uncharacterized protein
MNSCIYKARVMHHRLKPKKHRFSYNVFMFYLDLDELHTITEKIALISLHKFNVFSFRNNDHLQFPADNPDKSKSIKEHLLNYLSGNGIDRSKVGRTMLLTNLCTFGYQFNPVAFYLIYDTDRKPLCSVVEVCNTFREMKLYFIGKEHFDGQRFRLKTKKYFYVSPFIAHDAVFDFRIEPPDNKLNIRIDDIQQSDSNERFFISTLAGQKKALTNARVFFYALRFPLITLQVIGLIHWNALKLWLKKIPYYKKSDFKDLQRDVLREYKQ